jgi:hypothetical protein
LQSNSGAACTCVVTEYLYHDRDDFIVEVELFSQSELREQLTEMVHAYCQHHYRRSAGSEDEDVRHWEECAAVAQDSLEAMFQDRFTPALFRPGWSEDTILETLVGWAQELRPVNINRREVRTSFEDCSALVMKLTANARSSRGPPVWRYIKKIKFVVLKSPSPMWSLTAAG